MNKMKRKEFIELFSLSSAGMLVAPGLKTMNSPIIQYDATKIAIFSKALQWLDYKSAGKFAKDLGFSGIDLTVRPNGHVLPGNVETDLPKAVNAIRSQGVDVYTISTAIHDPEDPLTTKILKTASDLDIKYYRMDWLKHDPTIGVKKSLDKIRILFEKFEKINRKYRMQGAYQNHAGNNFGSNCFELWYGINGLDPEYVGCQYDIRHAMVEGAYSWPSVLELLAPYIKTIDIKDSYWKKQDAEWLLKEVQLGKGMVDFKTFFSLVAQFDIHALPIIHIEYESGGANHGAYTLGISEEEFVKMLREDRAYLKELLMSV